MKKHLLILLFVQLSFSVFSQTLSVTNLSCGYRTNPLGVDDIQPLLGWQLESSQRNVLQTAYQILVAEDSNMLKKSSMLFWDSKKVSASSSVQVKYNGMPLRSAKYYYWRVIVWDNKGNRAVSNIQYWQMGILTKQDWKNANWVAYDILPDSNKIIPAAHLNGKKSWGKRKNVLPLFRKTFTVSKKIKHATLFISGLGHFDAYLNGKKIGDHFLDPGWTKYDQQALYVAFSVKELLKKNNALGVMLGNGFYYVPGERYRKLTGAFGYPKMKCLLQIEYADGTVEDIVSDATWKTNPSPITFSSIFGGEDYDARLEQKDWNNAGFNDSHWQRALVTEGPALSAQSTEPLKVMQQFVPVKQTAIKDSTWVFDLAQNMSGIPQISVRGKKGDTVKITPAELLNDDGTVNQKSTGSPHYYLYVLKGEGVETWQPQFTYYGYRYLQVYGVVPEGKANPHQLPVLVSVKGLHTRNSVAKAGSFECSNQLFNQILKLIDWSVKSNMASVFTDCPHREKLGWLEEAYLVGSSIKFQYNIATLCKKAINDMIVSQTADGLIPEIAPEFVKFDAPFRDSPEWGSNAIILPWYVYQWYGDSDLLQIAYPMMQRYIQYLQSTDSAYILKQGLGDWYDIGPAHPGLSQNTPKGLTATATYYYDCRLLEKIAGILHKTKDSIQCHQLADSVKHAFNQMFFNAETMQYGGGNQTSNAMAVYMNLTDPQNKKNVINNIVKDIQSRNNALTAGDIGFRYLLKVLDDAGRSDIIFAMNNRSDVPGYGYQLAKGATALTESWQALPNVSNNHLMLGHIMEWFYEGIAGISQSEGSAGYKKMVIRPQITGDIDFARADFNSVYGTIKTDWKKTKDAFELKTTIPVNTSAMICLPAEEKSIIRINGEQLLNYKWENGYALLDIGSGDYVFQVKPAGNK